MRLRCLVLLPLVLLLAGCGSTRVVTVLTSSSATTSSSGHHVIRRNEGVATSGHAVRLSPSARQNQCVVANGSGQIIFYSQVLAVSQVCDAQDQVTGWRKGGQLSATGGHEVLLCYLRNASSTLVASVFDTQTGQVGPQACRDLISSGGWFEAQANAVPCRQSDGTTLDEPPGTKCSST